MLKEVVNLLEKIKKGQADIAEISRQTGIPYNKMHKWRSRNSDISLSDAIILEDYLRKMYNGTDSHTPIVQDEGIEYQVSLRKILDEIILTRADVRAFGEYQVMKDAKGDENVRSAIMEQINKLVSLNLGSGAKTGTPAGIQGKG